MNALANRFRVALPKLSKAGTFRSLAVPNYRLWVGGALISNTGTWMQRTSQDWLVLSELTDHSASALGIVMALQYGPTLLFLPFTGIASDFLNRRKLIMVTQALLGSLAIALGLLTITGRVELWHVYVFAFVSGSVSAFDGPARHTFVSELVDRAHLSNAVALNSTAFNAARMIGPAAAGLCIAMFGTGWAFLVNGASFAAVLISLFFIRESALQPTARAERIRGTFVESFRYIRGRQDLIVLFIMLSLVGTFTLNFSIFISTMAVSVFAVEAGRFGLLLSAIAVGTVTGALLAAGRDSPRFRTVVAGALALGTTLIVAAMAPSYWVFAALLVAVGISSMTFVNTSSSLLQLSVDEAMRGRMVALRMAIMAGGTPLGAPLIGVLADAFGPRAAVVFGATGSMAAAIVGWRYLRRQSARAAT